MSTSSAPRADTYGATSGATTPGTSAPGFEVLNSPNGPNSFFLSTVLRVLQAYSAWCSALSRCSPPTEIRRRSVLRFPRSQDEDPIFPMQRYASLNLHDSLSHRRDTGTRVWQYEGSNFVEDTMLPFSITPDTASKGLRSLASWNVIRLEMSPHRVFRCEILPSFLPESIFSPPRIVVLSLSPLTVSNQYLAIRLYSQPILLHRSQL